MCDLFGGGGGGGTVKTSSASAPWAPTQPGLKTGITDLTKLYKSGGLNFDYYPQSTVAPLAPERQEAWGMIADRARTGSPLTNQAKGYFSDVMGGKYLGADSPGLAGVLDRIRTGVNGNFAAGGRYGSGAHDSAVTSALAPTIYGDYQNERGLMDSAARFAPTLAAADYADADRLAGVGNERQAYAQDLTNDNVNRWNWDEKKKFNAIQLLMQALGGPSGGTTTSTQPKPAGNNNGLDFLGSALQAGAYAYGAH